MIEEEGGDSADEQHADRDDRGNPPTLHDLILAIPGGFAPADPRRAQLAGPLRPAPFARARWRSLDYVAPSFCSASAKYRLDMKIFRNLAREIGTDAGDGVSVDDPAIEPIAPRAGD